MTFNLNLLSVVAVVSLALPQSSGVRATFISTDKLDDGALQVEPIYTPALVLRPINAVGEAIGEGELLQCQSVVRERSGYLDDVEPSTVFEVHMNCDGARFVLEGIIFEP